MSVNCIYKAYVFTLRHVRVVYYTLDVRVYFDFRVETISSPMARNKRHETDKYVISCIGLIEKNQSTGDIRRRDFWRNSTRSGSRRVCSKVIDP